MYILCIDKIDNFCVVMVTEPARKYLLGPDHSPISGSPLDTYLSAADGAHAHNIPDTSQ